MTWKSRDAGTVYIPSVDREREKAKNNIILKVIRSDAAVREGLGVQFYIKLMKAARGAGEFAAFLRLPRKEINIALPC